jgi:DNA-binding Lrp family transcriptional regulator
MAYRQIDGVDRKLIALLEADAREPLAVLARKLGLSRTTVQERLARLQRDGVIEGYTIRLGADMRAAQLQAIVRFTMDPKHTTSVVARLTEIVEIKSCYSVSGAFDLIVFISAESALRLNQILDEIGNLDGVERTTSSIVLAVEFER